MYIVVTGYEVLDNYITKGGKAFPVALVLVGKLIQAKQDTYKWFYKEVGVYHYPPILENIIWRTGASYWSSLELMVSKEGTEKNPKISLLTAYRDKIIPAMEDEHVRLS